MEGGIHRIQKPESGWSGLFDTSSGYRIINPPDSDPNSLWNKLIRMGRPIHDFMTDQDIQLVNNSFLLTKIPVNSQESWFLFLPQKRKSSGRTVTEIISLQAPRISSMIRNISELVPPNIVRCLLIAAVYEAQDDAFTYANNFPLKKLKNILDTDSEIYTADPDIPSSITRILDFLEQKSGEPSEICNIIEDCKMRAFRLNLPLSEFVEYKFGDRNLLDSKTRLILTIKVSDDREAALQQLVSKPLDLITTFDNNTSALELKEIFRIVENLQNEPLDFARYCQEKQIRNSELISIVSLGQSSAPNSKRIAKLDYLIPYKDQYIPILKRWLRPDFLNQNIGLFLQYMKFIPDHQRKKLYKKIILTDKSIKIAAEKTSRKWEFPSGIPSGNPIKMTCVDRIRHIESSGFMWKFRYYWPSFSFVLLLITSLYIFIFGFDSSLKPNDFSSSYLVLSVISILGTIVTIRKSLKIKWEFLLLSSLVILPILLMQTDKLENSINIDRLEIELFTTAGIFLAALPILILILSKILQKHKSKSDTRTQFCNYWLGMGGVGN